MKTRQGTSALGGDGWSSPHPGRFTSRTGTRYPLYRRQAILLVSGLTILMAGLGANFEFDLKSIIALTLYDFESIRSYDYNYFHLSFWFGFIFHLLTHALSNP